MLIAICEPVVAASVVTRELVQCRWEVQSCKRGNCSDAAALVQSAKALRGLTEYLVQHRSVVRSRGDVR